MPFINGGGGGGAAFNGGTITTPLVIAPANPTSAPLTVQGPTGLIAAGYDLLEVLDELSNDRFQVFPDGAIRVDSAAGEVSRIVSGAASHSQINVADAGVSLNLGGGKSFFITTGLGSTFRVLETDGALRISNHAAPVDGDLSAGDCALWFDQTDGAAKLMVKGKSANGSVVAASIVLA